MDLISLLNQEAPQSLKEVKEFLVKGDKNLVLSCHFTTLLLVGNPILVSSLSAIPDGVTCDDLIDDILRRFDGCGSCEDCERDLVVEWWNAIRVRSLLLLGVSGLVLSFIDQTVIVVDPVTKKREVTYSLRSEETSEFLDEAIKKHLPRIKEVMHFNTMCAKAPLN